MMNGRDHLTEREIAGYRAGFFPENEKRAIARHLLQCVSCRGCLPAPRKEGFWAALMDEREDLQSEKSARTALVRPKAFLALRLNFGSSRFPVSCAAAVIMLSIISLIVWLTATQDPGMEKEVAQIFEPEMRNGNVDVVGISKYSSSIPTSRNGEGEYRADSNVLPPASNQSFTGEGLKKKEADSPDRKKYGQYEQNKSAAVRKTEEDFDSTRGGLSVNCGDKTVILTEGRGRKEGVLLKWKKVPKAVKYHLYISDDNEILIEEFETVRETEYLFRSSVEGKTYRWKILVTLENGESIVGEERKFILTDSPARRTDQKTTEGKKAEVRCSKVG